MAHKITVTMRSGPTQSKMFSNVAIKVLDWYCQSIVSPVGSFRPLIIMMMMMILIMIRHKSRRKGAREGGQIWQDLAREIKMLWKVKARVIAFVIGTSGTIPRALEENLRTLGITVKVDSESRTPRNSMNTKEGTGAWLQDSERENVVCYSSQATRHRHHHHICVYWEVVKRNSSKIQI